MSKSCLKALCLILLCLSLLPLSTQAAIDRQPASPNERPNERSRAVLDRLASKYPGLSVTVFVKGKAVWAAQTGQADIARHIPVTDETRFNIYSTSKAVTGLAFAKLIQKGRVSLDARVGDVAPGLPFAWHAIRLRHILSHTSGLRHYRSPEDWLAFASLRCMTPADALAYFKADALVDTPGRAEHYSTFAFVLASYLLIEITGEDDFASAINHTLGTSYVLDSPNAVKSIPYIEAGKLPALPAGASPTDMVPLPIQSAECKFGGGGLLATSYQLAQTGSALAEGQIIPRRRLIHALKPWSAVSAIVYGGAIRKIDHGGKTATAYGLSGGAPGGRSYLLVLIEPGISVAITGNFEGPNLESAAREIAGAW